MMISRLINSQILETKISEKMKRYLFNTEEGM